MPTSTPLSLGPLDFLLSAEKSGTFTAYLGDCLPVVMRQLSGDFAAITLASQRQRAVASAGVPRAWPLELVADCLDRESPLARGEWLAVPLSPRDPSGEILLVHRASGWGDVRSIETESLSHLAAALRSGFEIVRGRERLLQRAQRAETILSIVQQWGRTQEMEKLLSQMAEASTRLLNADRASIFLWDKTTRTLVGRPALGVKGGELRVPDDAGVVGEVLRTGQAQRVTQREVRDPVNRQIDSQLHYQTRNLVAAPLGSNRGELIGVFEVLNKTDGEFTADDEAALVELASHATVALENTKDWQQLLASHRQIVDQAAEHARLIGKSPAIEALRSTVRRVADTELAVLVLGENGTGKEVVSQLIHYLSRRRERPFVAVNCAAIAETLLESELFGHEKGAFTDAREARAGKFELAAGGTLFLDEIGDLSPGGQAKLLRVLEEKIVVRVGGSRPIPVDVRVLAATNQNLAELVRQKKFREDLYFRLNVVVLDLPPLRDRGDDVLLLAEHFLAEFSRRAGRKPPKLTPDAKKRLLQHHWPGNVRELRNLMERLAYLTVEEKIEPADLAFILSPSQDSAGLLVVDQPLSSATDRFQVEYIRKAIDRTRGNITEAADLLGLHRSNLYRKMKQLGMEE
jgi:transcriptional regulator with GAF, ATPase, and Fis domain